RAGAAGDGGLAARRADRAERVADLHSDLAGGCRVGAGGPASPAAPAARAAAPGRATAGLSSGRQADPDLYCLARAVLLSTPAPYPGAGGQSGHKPATPDRRTVCR